MKIITKVTIYFNVKHTYQVIWKRFKKKLKQDPNILRI